MWRNPNYDLHKEALEIIPMMTGQSKELCEIELMGDTYIMGKKRLQKHNYLVKLEENNI